ncbi:MAG: hypothetical protein IPH62_19805 [Ignavibacteriae bacterium]|nr:hypothetical protein [Ignavibacteriota bacterium]
MKKDNFKGKIRNAGVKTVEELNNLCWPIILQNEKEEIPKTDIDLLKFLSNKTLIERELLKSTAELVLKVSQISSIDIVKYGKNCKKFICNRIC